MTVVTETINFFFLPNDNNNQYKKIAIIAPRYAALLLPNITYKMTSHNSLFFKIYLTPFVIP